MPPTRHSATVLALVFGTVIAASLLLFGAAGAQSAVEATATPEAVISPPTPTPIPPSDSQCRGCHGNTAKSLTLPSGETLSVDVDLVALDASPHSSQTRGTRVLCFDCHVNATNYRYPHVVNDATSAREFSLTVMQSCENCHNSHKPFHGQENVGDAAQDALPGCADCHGNHDVARRTEIPAAMPARCIACHADKSPEWAQQYLTYREGKGVGAEGYAGSDRCLACHDDKFLGWQATLHANIVQNPQHNAAAIVADFAQGDPDLTFSREDVAYTVGGRWKQVFLGRRADGTLTILPAQWNVAEAEWTPYTPDHALAGSAVYDPADWQQACGSCHVTGLDTATGNFTEFGVGCESCHGPSAPHTQDPENVPPYAGEEIAADEQVCGSCHSRGLSPDGHPYPAAYRPGDTLADHFAFNPDAETTWPDGSARLSYQQYTDWLAGDRMGTGGKPVSGAETPISCATCHEVHAPAGQPGQLRQPGNALCLNCHTEQRALIDHMPYHEQAARRRNFQCTDCHMPRIAIGATNYAIHSHTFTQPDPQGSIDHGGVEAMPNACNNCHTELGEGPDWAVRMIAWTGEWATPTPAAAFGPGPTPTSPPPPTPLPSVGRPAEEHEPVATGRWLRYTVFAMMGLFVLLVLWLIVRWTIGRRQAHV